MSPELIGALADGAIPIVLGAYFTVIAYRDHADDPSGAGWWQWRDRYGRLLKVAGPAAVVCGILLVVAKLWWLNPG